MCHPGGVLLLNPLRSRPPSVGRFPTAAGAFPVVGHMPALATDTLAFLREAERRHGTFFFVEQGFGNRMLVCTDLAAFDGYKTRLGSSAYMRAAPLGDIFGESVIGQDGKTHQRMRAVLNGPFTPRGLSAAEVGPMIAGVVERRVRRLVRGEPFRVLAETRELALDVIFRIVGVGDEDLSEWREHYQDALLLLVNLPVMFPGSPRWRGRRGKTWIDARLHASIRAARREGPGREGLLPALVHGRGAEGETLSDDELVDNLRLLMLAGHETSASTMAWMLGFLAQRADLWDRLSSEVCAFGRVPRTPAELRELPFTEALFRETLRLYPPVANDARTLTGDLELSGRVVPEGTRLSIPIMHLSRHPELYERPDELWPDRWLGKKSIGPLELMQFGGGPHFCLGYHLAWMEIMQFAATLALVCAERDVAPRLASDPPAPRYLPLLHPSGSLRVTFDARG